MEIMEYAYALGQKLKEDSRLVAFEAAKKAFDEDTALKELMTELTVQQKAMANEMEKGADHDESMISMIQTRINQLYELIRVNPAFAELNRAQNDVNELMNAVNKTIMAQLGAEESEGCTHDCSTCGGCH